MAKIEVEESELVALQRVNKFAETALANPKTRAEMLRIQKTLNPDAVIPELDATDSVLRVVKGVEEKVEGFMSELRKERETNVEAARTTELTTRMKAGQDYLAKAGYNADGIKKIEDLMLAEGISSYGAGLAYFEKLNPPAAPSESTRTSPWGASLDNNIQDSEDYKRLWESQGQDDSWLNQSIARVRNEFRN